MEKVNRGEWTPTTARPAPTIAGAIAPAFQVEASQWLHRRRLLAGDPDGRSKTIRDLEWRLSVVMDKFGSEPIDRVDDAAERVLRDAAKRGVLTGEVPALKTAAPKSARPRRSFLEPEQVAAVIRAADLIEAEHRGLTWEAVALIRSSSGSAAALAREFRVSAAWCARSAVASCGAASQSGGAATTCPAG